MVEDKKTFGEYLVSIGTLTVNHLKEAQEQKRKGERLEQAILRLKYAEEELIFQCLADYFDLPYVDLNTYLIDETILSLVPEEMARRYILIPLFKIGNSLTVAMANPLDIHAVDEIRNKTKSDVEIAISTEDKIRKAIEQYYGLTGNLLESTLQQLVKGSTEEAPPEPGDYRKTYHLNTEEVQTTPGGDVPAARMFDLIMTQAIRDRASDIHFEPDEKSLRIRFRIDGFLYEFLNVPRRIHPSLISRIKVLSEMDIAETRLPQDGNHFPYHLRRKRGPPYIGSDQSPLSTRRPRFFGGNAPPL